MQMKRILLLLLPTLFAGAVRAEMPRFADRMPAAPATAAATAAIPAATPAATPETESAAERLERERAELRKQRFLPTRRRMNREINKLKYAYKGEVIIGLTAAYGTLSSDNADVLTILSSLSADGAIATVKPSVGYFYRDNRCLGVRFGYTHMNGTLDGDYDLGESNDFSGSLPYIDISSNNYSFGIFHRSYAGLDPKGRFGLFAEFELSVSTGSSNDAHKRDGELKRIYSDNTKLKLAFNPGAAVYIFPNVCATISFGLGGIQYTSVTQKDQDGNRIGSRKASNMRFRLNVAAINFGMTFHLWDKKKQ